MSLLNDASLVLIPSGYKEDKVYSIIPSDGSGDLDFVRGSEGTRINSLGQVENVCWNLAQYSEDFSNAYWLKSNTSVVANQTTAPNGTLTADKSIITANTSYHDSGIGVYPIINGNSYTVSVYGKKGVGIEALYFYEPTTNAIAKFNLNDGTYIGNAPAYNSFASYGSESVGNGWYRFYATFTAVSTTSNTIVIGISTNTTNTVTPLAGNGTDYLYIWGAQANIGALKPYFPTTDRLNVPRLTYENGCPSLLLEKQSTNTLTWSEDLNNAFSAKVGVTITANDTISPDGTQSADKLKFNTSSGYILRGQTVAALTTYTMSVFIKNNNFATGEILFFNMSDGVIGGLTAQINVAAKTAAFVGPASAWTSISGKIQDFGNDWYRVSITGTSVAGGSGWIELASPGVTNSCYVWGLQLELSDYSTSYIKTTSTSVTRLADSCYKTGISSLIGGTVGTIFFDINTNKVLSNSNYKQIFYYTDSSSNQAYMYLAPNNHVVTNPNLGSITSSITLNPNTRYKIAISYANNDFKLYINGVSVGSSSSGTVINAENILSIGSYNGTSEWNEFTFNEYIHFKKVLTNTELAQLTTI